MTPPEIHNLDDAKRVIAELCAVVEQSNATVTDLQSQVAWLKRQLFGRKSEAFALANQPGLFGASQASLNSDEWSSSDEPSNHNRHTPSQTTARRRGKRLPIPEDLPRVEQVHDLPEDEKAGMKRIGQEVSEQLNYEPGRVYVIRHVRYVYARIDESLDGSEANVITASRPDEGLRKCIAAPSLLAHIAMCKFGDHIPLNRLQGILKRSGVNIPRSSMCRWMQELAKMCRPLMALMQQRLLQSHVIQADETPVKQLDGSGENKGAKAAKTCYFWSYLGDDGHPYVFYDYQQNRSRAGPNAWFSDGDGTPNYRGYLQCDAYTGYGDLFDEREAWKMTHVACWAHVRRKFYDIRTQFPGPCHHALGQIQLLYQVEREARDLSADERQARRRTRSRPIVEALLAWCKAQHADALPKSGLGEAIHYVLNQADALKRYLDDGRLSIDNNACERRLRGIAIGRKNWLFTGSEAGGQAAATMFSLISSAKRNDIDPLTYLTDLFTRLPATSTSDLAQFLPDRWQLPR